MPHPESRYWDSYPFLPEPYHKPTVVTPRRARDHDGAEVYLVPVYHRVKQFTAKLFPEAWDALMEAGYSGDWFLHAVPSRDGRKLYAYVLARSSPNNDYPKPVARLITTAPIGWCVKYRDGNFLNLRYDNLRVTNARR